MRTFKEIIRKLNILPDDIDPIKYTQVISDLDVQKAIKVIELFPIHPKLINNLLDRSIIYKNYGLTNWIILNYTIDYDTLVEDHTLELIFYRLRIKNTEETKMLIEMLLKDIGKNRDEISRNSFFDPFDPEA